MKNAPELKPLDISGLPDPLAPNEEKLTDQYALKVATSIQQEWFGGGMITTNSLFAQRHQRIRELRIFNRGEQDIAYYKTIMARQEEDNSYLNMDWHITNYAEKFTNRVINGIGEENYRLDIRSADRFTLEQKRKKVLEHKKNMYAKKMLEKAKELQGIDLLPKGFVPEDEEELSLYSEIKERPKQEIAEEIMINFVKNISSWQHIKDQGDKDLVVNDLMVARVYTDPNNGVMIDSVDPESYGHSYVERNDFQDAFYHFVVEEITINDIRRETGWDDLHLRKIAKMYAGNNQKNTLNLDIVDINRVLEYKVHVMRFCVKGDKEIVFKKYLYKKEKTVKVARRDSNFKVPEGQENSRLSKRMDTWYEGSYIVGSNEYIWGWKESENLAKDDMDRVLPPFIAQSTNIYKNKLKSFLSNIVPIVNKLIMADFKIQHLMLELKPDLTVINLDQLAELNPDVEGESKQSNWKTALSILNVKGVILEKTIDLGDEGGIQRGQSARPATNQQGSALAPLLNVWAHYYNIIRETTGINPAMDGSLGKDSLVGVNQMMQLAGNVVTKHIVDAAVAWDKRVCETISARVKGIFKLPEARHLQKMYRNAVGKHNIDAIESLKHRHLHEFGYSIEMVPSKAELDELREDLNISLKEGTVDVSEKAEIMRIARVNTKQASEYMRFIRRRKIKEQMRENEYKQKLQSQSNAQAAQAKMQADLQLKQAASQLKMQEEMNMSQLRLEEALAMQQITAPEKEAQFQRDVYLEKIKSLRDIHLTQFKEKAKDDRVDHQSTRQSQLIEQRQKDLGAFDFKKKFDLEELLA